MHSRTYVTIRPEDQPVVRCHDKTIGLDLAKYGQVTLIVSDPVYLLRLALVAVEAAHELHLQLTRDLPEDARLLPWENREILDRVTLAALHMRQDQAQEENEHA